MVVRIFLRSMWAHLGTHRNGTHPALHHTGPRSAALLAFALLATATPAAVSATPSPLPRALPVAQELPTAPLANPTLEQALQSLIDQPRFAQARVSVAVLDLASDRWLFRRNDTLALNPASNTKLVTTAAALGLLGPAYRYSTRLYHDGKHPTTETLDSDLYLRGGGDPALTTEDIYELVNQLRARGIRRITGGIVVDSSRFDHDELPPGFDQKDELAAYRAPTGATSTNYNTFVVHVRPGELGAPPKVVVDPPVASIKIVNLAKVAEGRRDRLTAAIEVKKGVTTLTLGGTLGAELELRSYRYPVADPSRYSGEVLREMLHQRGIRLGRRGIRLAPIPERAQLVATHYSDPLSVLVRGANKYSNNFIAEQLLKTLAPDDAPASFSTALQRVRDYLGSIGVVGETIALGNGSGLYDNNRLSARSLVQLLAAMQADFRVSEDFVASLAIMGVDGTTRKRLRDSRHRGWVRAKTGTLDGIYCLSGYVGAADRKPLAFAILFNDLPRADAAMARATQNQIVELLARHAAGEPLFDPLPAGPEDDAEGLGEGDGVE